MFKKLFHYITGDFGLGAICTAFAIILFSAGETQTGFSTSQAWDQISKGGTIIASILALFAGRYVWISKKHELKTQEKQQRKEAQNLKCKLAAEMIALHLRAQHLLNISYLRIPSELVLKNDFIEDYAYLCKEHKNVFQILDLKTIRNLSYLDLLIANFNRILTIKRNELNTVPNNKFELDERMRKDLEQIAEIAQKIAARTDILTVKKIYELELSTRELLHIEK